MADTTSFDKIIVQGAIASAPRPARVKSRAKTAGSVFIWVGLLAMGVAAIAPISHFTLQEAETAMLLQADNASAARAIEQDWSQSTSPDYVETLAELGMQMPVVDTGSAYVAASRATELDPSRAFAWAQLAYIEAQRASGKVNAASLHALTQSMDACPLCDDALISWRFNFVLTNWASIPETLRVRAFEQADVLRWIGPNAEFLAEMRAKARQSGIPFDAYRAAVNTPARTWDIGPASQPKPARGAPST
ncbi:MAG: hypothetical protein Q8R82_20630 [Hyphomonadaceae bacterium]|nr:hypothetical protein [Hyphomonadaceae bacterium]